MSLDDDRQPVEIRQVSDPRALRALAHPVRIALLEELSLSGAMTATQLGERIGESPTTCSFHLRQLARYGFVEEAGGGKGRARPWRVSSIGMAISHTDDPEGRLAAEAVTRVLAERNVARHRRWLATKDSYPKEWQDSESQSQHVFYLTVAEHQQVKDELDAVLMTVEQKYRDRLADPALRPPDSVPVELLMLTYPLGQPSAQHGTDS